MRVAITDANIFIDLLYLEFIHYLFELDIEIYTSIEVLEELKSEQQEILSLYQKKDLLKVKISTAEELQEAHSIIFPKGLSEQDKSVYFFAFKNKTMVLSGDMKLRRFCQKSGLDVHGILWLFDQFVEKTYISRKHAVDKINSLMKYNECLPIDECLKRIAKWSE